MESGAVELEEGEMFIVPKGVRHNPVAERECLLMLIDRKSTLHTGDVTTERREASRINCDRCSNGGPWPASTRRSPPEGRHGVGEALARAKPLLRSSGPLDRNAQVGLLSAASCSSMGLPSGSSS